MEKIIETVESIMNKQKIQEASGKGHRSTLCGVSGTVLWKMHRRSLKYAVYYAIADGRSGFSKTDHSATFMHMKYDYYNHTNVFKPGIQCTDGQFGWIYGISTYRATPMISTRIYRLWRAITGHTKNIRQRPRLMPAWKL